MEKRLPAAATRGTVHGKAGLGGRPGHGRRRRYGALEGVPVNRGRRGTALHHRHLSRIHKGPQIDNRDPFAGLHADGDAEDLLRFGHQHTPTQLFIENVEHRVVVHTLIVVVVCAITSRDHDSLDGTGRPLRLGRVTAAADQYFYVNIISLSPGPMEEGMLFMDNPII